MASSSGVSHRYFEWNGHRWDANDISKERLDISLKAAESGLPDNFFWTDADNNDVPVTQEQLKELGMRMTRRCSTASSAPTNDRG
ncbi:DUF4376 domain-containing protein [Yersinia pestis]|uniref:DUF4376 domain-containing protein n=1 Tax=Yersinia pestis TaxID=632 RepID=UPI003B75C6F9